MNAAANDDSQVEAIAPSSNRKVLFCCCLGILILTLLTGAFIFAVVFLAEDSTSDIDEEENAAGQQEVLFLGSIPPDYSISEEKEIEFRNILDENFDEAERKDVTSLADELKDNYPEGYFVLVTETLASTATLKNLVTALNMGLLSDAGLLVHEMTHVQSFRCGSYLIEDKCIEIHDHSMLRNTLFTGNELLPYITDQDTDDTLYLEENNQTIVTILDEVNAYIKSVRTARAYNDVDSSSSSLARQMYYVTLYLKHAKEQERDDWDMLVDNKGFAFVLMRLTAMADAELNQTEGKMLGLITPVNMDLYQQNRMYIDQFLAASGVSEIDSDSVTYDELQTMGILFDMRTP